MNTDSASESISLLTPDQVWDRIDPLAPGLDDKAGLGELPSAKLKGPGFERLCYEILVAQGHSPRFFGRSGQKDLGVDIIVESGDIRTVYQCKNLTPAPAWTDIRRAVKTFENDWLNQAGLPAPKGYVYCCPHPLDDETLGEEWTKFKDEFRRRTGVGITFWDKNTLDSHLRRLPDVVAGVFSAAYAEHFCGLENWQDDPWLQVCRGDARHPVLKRFLDQHQQGRIYTDPADKDSFMDILDQQGVVACLGPPGTGKTSLALELSCQLQPRRRIYYAALQPDSNLDRLWQTARRRCHLPAVFVLDDSHHNLDLAGIMQERLRPELNSGKAKLVVLARSVAPSNTGPDDLDDTPDWLARMQEEKAVIRLMSSVKRTRSVTECLRPDWRGMTESHLNKLHHASGGDFVLLDAWLHTLKRPADLDTLHPGALHKSIRDRFFHKNRRLPTLRRLACLAQFELVPLADYFGNWPTEEKALAAPLMGEWFPPPRYQFLHSSLAQLIFRALYALEVPAKNFEAQAAEATAKELSAYFKFLLARGSVEESGFAYSLQSVLRSRLLFVENTSEATVKARFLAEPEIQRGIEQALTLFSFSELGLCLLNLSLASRPALPDYTGLMEQRFRLLFQAGHGGDPIGLATVGTGLFALKRHSPETLENIQSEHGPDKFLNLIAANGTVFELFMFLKHATPGFRAALLDRLDAATVERLVESSLSTERKIKSFHHILRQLSHEQGQRERLEACFKAEVWWRLFTGLGSLHALSLCSQAMSKPMRRRLLEASTTLRVEDWQAMLARGLFLNACDFVRKDLATYPSSNQAAFLTALRQEAQPLANRASWFDLNPSHPPTESEAGQVLSAALRQRLDTVKLEDLHGLDFRETVNALALLWRERENLRPDLAANLRAILPPCSKWPKEKGEIAALRLVLAIARSDALARQAALALADDLAAFLSPEVCAEIHTLPLFLLLWNLAALRYERGGISDFGEALPKGLLDTAVGLLQQRVQPKGGNHEKLAQLALAGLVVFLQPSRARSLGVVLQPLATRVKWLLPEACEKSFLPALCALEGIQLIQPPPGFHPVRLPAFAGCGGGV